MKRLSFILISLLFATTAMHAQTSNFNHLSEVAQKEKGHFVGKSGGINQGDPYMWTYAVVWDFWTLFGEPCYDFRFRWEARPASLLAGDYYYQGHKISEYPDLQKLVKKLHPIFLGGDKEPVTVSLAIQVKKGGTVLANLWHSAVIDLPDIAGKWNTFSMPASADWLQVFTPLRTGLEKQELWGEVGSRQSEVTSAYNSGNKRKRLALMVGGYPQKANLKV